MSDSIGPDRGRDPIRLDASDDSVEQQRYANGRALPGNTTAPARVLSSIVFGLLALTGSIVLLSLVASFIVIAWVIFVGRPDGRDERGPDHPSPGLTGISGPWR